MLPGVTVLGNVSVDLIDGGSPSPGGCPSFAAAALDSVGTEGRIVTQMARKDRGLFLPLFAAYSTDIVVIDSLITSSFGLCYDGEDRELTVEAVGPVWGLDEVCTASPNTTWVHVSPLLRQDFPGATLEALASRGHQLSYDGQGLVRAAQLGPMCIDLNFPLSLLRHVSVLKLADDEANELVEHEFDEAAARWLGVPEILVTHGSAGCDLYVDGLRTHVAAAWRVEGVHTTGAGDMFTTFYVGSRAFGLGPVEAAERSSVFVAKRLQARLEDHGPRD